MSKFAHIPNEEIIRDLSDTRYEIQEMERKIKGYRLIGDKMSHFRADAMEHGIKERLEFIEKLETILKEREKI